MPTTPHRELPEVTYRCCGFVSTTRTAFYSEFMRCAICGKQIEGAVTMIPDDLREKAGFPNARA